MKYVIIIDIKTVGVSLSTKIANIADKVEKALTAEGKKVEIISVAKIRENKEDGDV